MNGSNTISGDRCTRRCIQLDACLIVIEYTAAKIRLAYQVFLDKPSRHYGFVRGKDKNRPFPSVTTTQPGRRISECVAIVEEDVVLHGDVVRGRVVNIDPALCGPDDLQSIYGYIAYIADAYPISSGPAYLYCMARRTRSI
jgi:hypothetical protein